MYQLYVADDAGLAAGRRAGCSTPTSSPGPAASTASGGCCPTSTRPAARSTTRMIASAYLPGDANTDGSVNYADFQTLQANYGSTNAWWVNGDFNDDGTVNWADLNLLRQNLTPAGFTLSQFAQQAVFGQAATVDPTTRSGVRRLRRHLRERPAAVLDVRDRARQRDQHGAADRPRRRDLQRGPRLRRQLLDHHCAQRPVFALRQHHRRGQHELGRVLGDLPGLRRWPAAVPVADPRERIRRGADRRERRGREEPHARRGGGAGQLRIRRSRRLGRRPADLHGQFRRPRRPTP